MMTYAKLATRHSRSTQLLSQGVTLSTHCPLMAVANGFLSEASSDDRDFPDGSHQNSHRADCHLSLALTPRETSSGDSF